jgi:hypothetical protein
VEGGGQSAGNNKTPPNPGASECGSSVKAGIRGRTDDHTIDAPGFFSREGDGNYETVGLHREQQRIVGVDRVQLEAPAQRRDRGQRPDQESAVLDEHLDLATHHLP